MNRLCIVMVFFISQIVRPTSDQELFLQGNTHFLQGKFNQARKDYEAILDKSSAVWHNIGNCYFNEKNNVKALISWKRAEQGAGFFQRGELFEFESKALKNLSLSSENTIVQSVKQFVLGAPMILLQLCLLLLLVIFLFHSYQCIWQNVAYRYKRNLLGRVLFFILIILTTLFVRERIMHKKEAVVITQKALVYIGPETTFSHKAELSSGSVVQVLEEQDAMVKIRYFQGSGWIARDNIEIV